ncbi:MAG: LytTR family DNA-binding domain-containing protein [Bacteroidetes bacterium]|nr:LytTR family DNA-binding domain-containing protein [Bacteroidota bacterium]
MKAVIVDDEELGSATLEKMVHQHAAGIKVVARASSAAEGKAAILQHQPELVFLDIEMPGGSGFDLLAEFENPSFQVIFVTGFDRYALQAIKCCAVDYLLKPVEPAELLRSLEKLKRTTQPVTLERLQHLVDFIAKPRNKSNKICVPTQSGMELIPASDILYCEASREYTILHTAGHGSIISSYNIGEFESMLEDFGFFRIHNSYIINHDRVVRYNKGEGGTVIMSNQNELPVSRRRKTEFLEWLKG